MSNKTKKYLISTAIYILLATFVLWDEKLTTGIKFLVVMIYAIWMMCTKIGLILEENPKIKS